MREQNIRLKARKINMLATDVDGVLTDGRIVLGNNGEELKFFHVHDGKGVKLAQEAGIRVAIITGRSSELVERRARELGVNEIHQGCDDKLKVLEQLLSRYKLKSDQVAYIGDDLNDLPVLREVGLALTVADAVGRVRELADYVSEKKGGRGAVREIVEMILGYRQ